MNFFLFAVFLCTSRIVSTSFFKAKVKNNFFTDDYGRVRLYHGINAVSKDFPWVPNSGHVNLMNATILDDFQDWGFNVVRLGIMWTGLRPSRDYINMTYLNEMIRIIDNLAVRDMYVIVDLHQDMLSTKYGSYDGAPRWLLDLMPDSVLSYPWPFRKNDLGFAAYLTESCGFGFQCLYSNTNGFADYYAEYWAIVADAFADLPNILGYELLNEPWAGDIYADPLLLLPGEAGKKNLMPLYNKVYDVIRKYDKETIVFYEPVTWGVALNGLASGTGFNSTPGNDPERTSLAWHYYCWLLQFSPNPLKNDTYPLFDRTVCDEILIEASFKAVKYDKNVLNGASFLTEFGVCAFGMHNGTLILDECDYVLNAADKYFESWTYWDSNFYDANGHRIPELVNSFSRVYPVATCGTPVDLYYNKTTKLFVYSYELDVGINEPTLIFIPDHAYPRGSFQVSTTDGLLWSFNQTSRLLAVYVDTDHTVSKKLAKVMVMPIVDMKKTLFN